MADTKSNSPEALRAARKERLAAAGGKTAKSHTCDKCGNVWEGDSEECAKCAAGKPAEAPAGGGGGGGEPGQPGADPSTPVQHSAPAAAPASTGSQPAKGASAAAPDPKTASRELTARVSDPADIDSKAVVQIVGPFGNEKDAHWMVIAGGKPLAEIRLEDQAEPEKLAKYFSTADYAEGFKSALSKAPLTALLKSTRARPYVAVVKSTDAFTGMKDSMEATAKEAFQKKVATFRDNLLTMINLVAEAQRKNYITKNPLKDALFTALKRAGVQDPVPVIEAAFVEASGAHFEQMVKKAIQWLDFSPEALADVKQTILDMPVRDLTDARTASAAPREGLVPSSKANVPIVTAGTGGGEAPDLKSDLKTTFGFRERMHGREMGGNG